MGSGRRGQGGRDTNAEASARRIKRHRAERRTLQWAAKETNQHSQLNALQKQTGRLGAPTQPKDAWQCSQENTLSVLQVRRAFTKASGLQLQTPSIHLAELPTSQKSPLLRRPPVLPDSVLTPPWFFSIPQLPLRGPSPPNPNPHKISNFHKKATKPPREGHSPTPVIWWRSLILSIQKRR